MKSSGSGSGLGGWHRPQFSPTANGQEAQTCLTRRKPQDKYKEPASYTRCTALQPMIPLGRTAPSLHGPERQAQLAVQPAYLRRANVGRAKGLTIRNYAPKNLAKLIRLSSGCFVNYKFGQTYGALQGFWGCKSLRAVWEVVLRGLGVIPSPGLRHSFAASAVGLIRFPGFL